MALTKSLVLNTDCKMPLLGFGTWQAPKDEIQASVETAIDVGYRHIDGAWVYQNEEGTGLALDKKIKEGKIKREDMFITSKLWCTYYRPTEVRKCLNDTLKKLKTSYVDLYLMHWPFAMPPNSKNEALSRDEKGDLLEDLIDYVETWKVMEELYKEGLAKNIGVSNFNMYQLNRVLNEGSVVPTINQIETHPYLQERPLVDFCKSKGIQLTAYSPLGSPQRPWGTSDEPVVLNDPTLKAIGKKYGKSAAQVMIRFQVQRGVTVIPKSIKAHRIKENSEVFDFELSEGDMKEIADLNKDLRLCGMNVANQLKYWPFQPNYSE